MLRRSVLILPFLIATYQLAAQTQPSKEPVPVEVVATASEYVPSSTTVTHPGHSYTNCLGSTSYFARFRSYGDSGSVSGSADTRTNCETNYTPPTETTLTSYRKVNYTIAKAEHGVYLLSCTQTWKPSGTARGVAALHGALAGVGGHEQPEEKQAQIKSSRGAWSECPAFSIGTKYALTLNSVSDARLVSEDAQREKPKKPIKVEYLGSASLAVPRLEHPPAQAASSPDGEKAGNGPGVNDALSIGSVSLRLGMAKDVVLYELGKHYAVTCSMCPPQGIPFENWLIYEKARPDELLGEVRIRSGKLASASKHWTHENKDYSGADTAEIIYKVLSKFDAEGKTCTIKTGASLQSSGPSELEFRETQITCGHRDIEIYLNWQSSRPAYVQVTESITNESK